MSRNKKRKRKLLFISLYLMRPNAPPAAAGRVLLGVDFVFVLFHFTSIPLTLNHLARLVVAGMLGCVKFDNNQYLQNFPK